MEINVTFYTSENNIEKYFRKGQLESLPRVGDKMELLVGGNLKKFEIIEVIHRVGSQGVKIIIQ